MIKWTKTEYSYPYSDNPEQDIPFRNWDIGQTTGHLLWCYLVNQKCRTSLKGFLNSVVKDLGGLISLGIGEFISIIPGLDKIGSEISGLLKNQLYDIANTKINDAIKTGIQSLGIDEYVKYSNVPIFAENDFINETARQWHIMDAPGDTITRDHLVFAKSAYQYLSNPPWYQKFIIRGDFDDSELSNSYLNLVLAVRYLLPRYSQEMQGGGNPPPADKKFFFDDGIGYWIESLTPGVNRNRANQISKFVGSMEITTDQNEYNDWKIRMENIKQNAMNNHLQQETKNQSNLALLGTIASFIALKGGS